MLPKLSSIQRKYTYFTRPTTNLKKEGAKKPKPLSCPQEKEITEIQTEKYIRFNI